MLQKCSVWRTAAVFFNEPTKIHYLKSISRKIGLAHTSVKKHVEFLLGEGIIKKKKGDIYPGYVANTDNEVFKFYKRLYNLELLRESGLEDMIVSKLNPRAIVLFGSFLRGEDLESGDVDIFVHSKVEEDLDLKKYERYLNRKVQVIIHSNPKNLNSGLKNNILNGLVLHGYLKVFD